MIPTRAGNARAWHREPMLWLVIGVPAATVVAGVLTLLLALRSGGSDVATDSVRRTAQIQQTDLAADRAALQRGLSGSLLVDGEGVVTVQIAGSADPAVALHLRFVHPLDSAADRSLRLQHVDDRWQGRLALPREHAWTVQLQPEGGAWRLDGALAVDAQHVLLLPRFGRD